MAFEGVMPSEPSPQERERERARKARLLTKGQRFGTNPDIVDQLQKKREGTYRPETPPTQH